MAKDMKYGQSETPIMYTKNHLKLPSRKLWQKENVTPKPNDWSEFMNADNDKWDIIMAPKFVNFSDLPDIGNSFFSNVTAIVSTPKPALENSQLASSVHQEDEDTLIASFGTVNLSGIKQEPHQETYKACNSGNANVTQEYKKNAVDNDTSREMRKNKLENSVKPKKPRPAMVHPFTFEMRDKQKQELKQERINKILEEEKKVRIFRAKPAPKFLKTRPLLINKRDGDNNHDNHRENNNDKMDVANHDKVQGLDIHKKPTKHVEVWKKPPFVPCLPKENPVRPKTPPLQTTIRAQQRKHYDDSIKEKQRQKEQAAQMEIANKKKQEEEEIARLRKQTVHKAQPVPKYKLVLPVIQKRPLTDPITPLSFKRRRRV